MTNNRAEQPVLSLSAELQQNLANIKQLLQEPRDLIVREFRLGRSGVPCGIICFEGLVDANMVNRQILAPLLAYQENGDGNLGEFSPELSSFIENEVLSSFSVSRTAAPEKALRQLLAGDTLLLMDGSAEVIVIASCGRDGRAIDEPQTESIIRGPREGFTENIRTNTGLIRRRVKDPNLRMKTRMLGVRSQTEVTLLYIEGIAQTDLIQEAERRLNSIDVDEINSSGFIEQWISDSFLTPFPLIMNTERPDKVAGSLLQGRLAVLVDGDPFALVLPITFASSIKSPEDYYQHWLISTLTRLLRVVAIFIATFLPALYIALLEYQHGMIPSKLAFSIAGSREGVPFPAVVEAFVMEFTLEMLREAGLRLPKPIGQTIGIVGGLVIGEAAVSAGVVSPIMVIVVAITAISSFALPSYTFAISLRMIRFGVMLAAAFFGIYGIILVFIMINIHFVNLKSFGLPYAAPFAPTFPRDWRDLLLRAPVFLLGKRTQMMKPKDKRKMKPGSGNHDQT
ncbi:spore germination protein [Paenibacillus sp. UNCCL117]|uniref:spore germination protein n=1 Tax=unclassified Paenibacillus TaxID=185978 RepID=UPI00088AE240|nr:MULTISPECIES: spore germination protein [unclassified Paenibacillus]SDC66125.1 spore germination protein [Paenibacillus sp. cl123]SFW22957.1 spore germination protein [Paenibacillus sp. UNCCL117]